MANPVSRRSSIPENQSSPTSLPIRQPSIRFADGNEIRSMANADGGNCITDAFAYLLDKIKSFLSWIFPSLFSPSEITPPLPSQHTTTPATHPLSNRNAPLDQMNSTSQSSPTRSLEYRIEKAKEMLSQNFRHNPYGPQSLTSVFLSVFNKNLHRSTFATIVKISYDDDASLANSAIEEGYMVGQSHPDPLAFLESKVADFLTRHVSIDKGRFEIHTTFVQRTSSEDVTHGTVGKSIFFPHGGINFASEWKPFSTYINVEGPSIFRFCTYITDAFAGCKNHNTESIFPSLPNGVFFSGSCPQQLQRAITELPYPK